LAVKRRHAQLQREESPLVRAAGRVQECVALAAEAQEPFAESFVAEQPGQPVLFRPEFSRQQAKRAWVQRVVALGVE
jgi:hypothetical protein